MKQYIRSTCDVYQSSILNLHFKNYASRKHRHRCIRNTLYETNGIRHIAILTLMPLLKLQDRLIIRKHFATNFHHAHSVRTDFVTSFAHIVGTAPTQLAQSSVTGKRTERPNLCGAVLDTSPLSDSYTRHLYSTSVV